MYERTEERVFDWKVSCEGYEIFVLTDENMGRAIVMDGMKAVSKVTFVDNLLRVNTIEGYAAQIDFEGKIITILKENC